MRGRVTGTKPPCPVHPEPAFPPGTFLSPMNPDQAGDWYANMAPGPPPHEACERRGGVCDCAGRPCGLDSTVPVHGAVGACVLNGCQNAEWSVVAREAIAECERLRDQKRTDDEREIAYVQTIGRLDAALRGMVDLYRHPDTGRVIVEAGASDADEALIRAIEALDR